MWMVQFTAYITRDFYDPANFQMNPETVFAIIIAIVIFNFVFSRILEYMNSTRYGAPIPAELEDVYDKEEYKKSMDYKKVNYRFAILTGTFSLAVILLMLFYSGFAFADNLVRNVTGHPILVTLLFFGLLMFASDLINIPFSLYDTFVIEERFGFNKTTVKTFILDKLKSWMLGIIMGGGILAVIVWFYILTGQKLLDICMDLYQYLHHLHVYVLFQPDCPTV